jgi:hypothetical protein
MSRVIVVDEVKLPPEAKAASDAFWERFNSLSPEAKQLVTLVGANLFRPSMPLLWEGDQA